MTALAFKQNPRTDFFSRDFAANATDLPGAGLAWLDARRRAALEAFAKTGVPNRRVEAWKYTDLASALEGDLEPVTHFRGPVSGHGGFAGYTGTRVTLVSGYFCEVESQDRQLDLVDLGELADVKTQGGPVPEWVKDNLGRLASGPEQPLGAASLALMRGGVAIRVPKGEMSSVHFEFIDPPRGHDWVSHARVLVVVEEGASLRLLQSHVGTGAEQSLSNLGIELVLKQGAKLEHILMQKEPPSALHVASIGALISRDAEYRAPQMALGAKLSRLDVNLKLAEAGAQAVLHNVAVLDSGIADTTTIMDHASPHTTSRQLFKSAVGGRGRSVSQGRVTVREGAVKSDLHQLFKALLLSPRAEADAKPELEIFADDVVCGHGTAIGALDTDALFYLRARGIPEGEAKGLLIRAFLDETLEGFADEAIREGLSGRLDDALRALGNTPT